MNFFNAVAVSCLLFASKSPSVTAEAPSFSDDGDEALDRFKAKVLADSDKYIELLKKKNALEKDCYDDSLPVTSKVEACEAAYLMLESFYAFDKALSKDLSLLLALELENFKKQKPDAYESVKEDAKEIEEEPIWFKWMKGEIKDDEASGEEAGWKWLKDNTEDDEVAPTESYQF